MRLNSTTRRKSSVTFIAATLLLSSLALFAPIQRVNAQGAVLSVNGGAGIVAAVGSSFTAPILVSSIANLNSFDIALSFDASQATYQSTSLPAPWVQAKFVLLPGSVRMIASSSIPVSDTGAGTLLVTHTFTLNIAGRSILSIASQSTLAVLTSGGVAAEPYTALNTMVKSSSKATTRFIDVKASSTLVDFTAGQTSMILVATLGNSGTAPTFAFVAYRLLSLSGTVFGVSSGTITVPIIGNAVSTTTFLLDPVPTVFVGEAALFVSTDGGATFTLSDARQLNEPITVIA